MIHSIRPASRPASRPVSRIKNKVTVPSIPRDQDVVLHNIQKKLQLAVETALVCHRTHVDSIECANLWGDVEELTKTMRDHLDNAPIADPLGLWCETHPRDPECRIFD